MRNRFATVICLFAVMLMVVLTGCSAWGNRHVSASAQEALDKLNTLQVKGRAPKTGYSRDQFGQAWADVDHNHCDTRNDILRRDLTSTHVKDGCSVLTGVLHDPYMGSTINFVRGPKSSDAIQIDHVVALSDAWQKGAQDLSASQREKLANDPMNLLAVDGPTNQGKGDSDAATWLPPRKEFRCTYVSKQVDVKAKYHLWVTQAEKDAIASTLKNCASDPAGPAGPTNAEGVAGSSSSAGSSPTTSTPAAENPSDSASASSQPQASASAATDTAANEVYYPNCAAARQASAAPIHSGEPGYRPGLDGDRDGVACD
ncbi:DUF1524 domain-containing protein [Rothia sp. LK2588]|uniref:GmrSD restriction endonuclease domain-containing protein n=1 Tax=Rothia sp. LK2588 TaxID=3114369 RepID=UPI0034CE8A06